MVETQHWESGGLSGFPTLPQTSFVTLVKSLHLSVSQFLHP